MSPDFLFPTIPKKKKFLILLLALITASVASWAVPFQYPGAGLDPSWSEALVQATDSGRIFGRDIIFTFGPLHQALTAQVSTNLAPLIFSRLAFTAVWLFAQILIGTLIGCWAEASIALAMLLSAGSHGDVVFYLIALVGISAPATARLNTINKDTWDFLLLSVILLSGSLLATLVKLSYVGAFVPALVYTLGMYASDAYNKRSLKSFGKLAAIFVFPLLILAAAWSLASESTVGNLLNYYFGPNLEVIKGYTDAMSYGPSIKSLALVFIYLISFSSLLFLFSTLVLGVKPGRVGLWRTAGSPNYYLSLACLSLLAWVVFKSSFVRDDSGHTLLGGLFLACFLCIIIGFYRERPQKSFFSENGEFVACAFIIPFLTTAFLAIVSGYRPSPSTPLRYAQGFFYSFKLLAPGGRKWLNSNRKSALEQIKATSEDYKIRQGATADVMPWDISHVIANELYYKPRPIPQSYAVYSQNLQELNNRFLENLRTSPDWLIVDIKDIDGRLPIGLDSSSLASMKSLYSFSHSGSQGSLVFSKKNDLKDKTIRTPAPSICKTNSKGTLKWLKTGKLRWQSQSLELPRENGGFLLLSTELKDSFSRSLLSSLYRPFPVELEYLNAAGEVLSVYRFIPKAGREMIIYPIIKSNDEFYNAIYLGMPAIGDGSDKVTSLRLTTRNIMPPFSRSEYTLSFGCGDY